MTQLIINALLLTMNGREVIPDGCIEVSDGCISYVGKYGDYTPRQTYSIIDAHGGIVMPAFINTHNHLAMTYFRSFASDLPLDRWLGNIWPVEDKMDEEILYYGSLVACAEAMEHGTACVNDMYMGVDANARACIESGIRACISRPIVDTDGPDGLKRRMEESRALFSKYDGACGRIRVIPSAHAEYTCSPQALLEVYAEAERINRPVHIHISETQSEVEQCVKRHGTTPLGLLDRIGALSKAPTLAAHCVAVTPEDISLMKQYNVSVLHNPCSNLKLASGVAPIEEMRGAGVNICIGTDGNGSNNNLDMFRETFAASLLQKGINKNASAFDAFAALEAATVNGGKALSTGTGILKKDAPADIMLLRPSPFQMPLHDPFASVVYSAESKALDTLMVNGRITVKDGHCVTIDRNYALSGFAKAVRRIFGNNFEAFRLFGR